MKTTDILIENNAPLAREELKRALAQWANGVGGELVNLTQRDKAHRGTPVDTGRLARSMDYATTKDNKTVAVGTNVEYAEFVEEGAQGRSGARMLRNAIVDVQDFAVEWLKFVLEANKSP